MAVAATSSILWDLESRAAAGRGEPRLELLDVHFPLLFVVWAGELQPQQVLQLIRFTDAARERAVRERTRLLTICDGREAVRPSDLVRDMLVDWLGDANMHLGLGSVIITRDPIIRGVIASLKWAIGRNGTELHVVQRPEEALERARMQLLKAGLPLPAVLDLSVADDQTIE